MTNVHHFDPVRWQQTRRTLVRAQGALLSQMSQSHAVELLVDLIPGIATQGKQEGKEQGHVFTQLPFVYTGRNMCL